MPPFTTDESSSTLQWLLLFLDLIFCWNGTPHSSYNFKICHQEKLWGSSLVSVFWNAQNFDIQCNQACFAYWNMPDRYIEEVIAKVCKPMRQWEKLENEGNGNSKILAKEGRIRAGILQRLPEARQAVQLWDQSGCNSRFLTWRSTVILVSLTCKSVGQGTKWESRARGSSFLAIAGLNFRVEISV